MLGRRMPRQDPLLGQLRMDLAPELQQQSREAVPRTPRRMHPRVAAAAERDQPPENVHTWPPMMHEDVIGVSAVPAAIAVSFERRFAQAIKRFEAQTPAAIARRAAASRVNDLVAAGAPKRFLGHGCLTGVSSRTSTRANRQSLIVLPYIAACRFICAAM